MQSRCTLLTPSSLSFAAFTLWLLAFPMVGPLQADNMHVNALYLFLIPHITGFIFFALCVPKKLEMITALGTLLTIAATTAFAISSIPATLTLPLSGIGGAALAVRVGVQVGQSKYPARSACLGLVIANLGLAGIVMLPLSLAVKFLIVVSLLLLPLMLKLEPTPKGSLKPLAVVLPFAFIYHLIAGFLYSFLFPLYQSTAWAEGFELIGYCLAVVFALLLFLKNPVTPLFAGVVLAIISCVLLYSMTNTGINLGMWTLQGASGCVDLFLVAYLVTRQNPAQSFAAGCITICSGILVGSLITESFKASPSLLVFSSCVVLNLAALSLFLLYRKHSNSLQPESSQSVLPATVASLLSEREFMVLKRVLAGAVYREIADEMSISESSVKTYMNRIYEKTQTRGKKQLIRRFEEVPL